MSITRKIHRQYINGVPYWVVRIGKKLGAAEPYKKYFATKTEAKAYLDKLIEIRNEVGNAKLQFMLAHGDEVMLAYQRLSALGVTLTEVVDFFVLRVAPGKASKTLQAAADEYIQALSDKAQKLFKEKGDDRNWLTRKMRKAAPKQSARSMESASDVVIAAEPHFIFLMHLAPYFAAADEVLFGRLEKTLKILSGGLLDIARKKLEMRTIAIGEA